MVTETLAQVAPRYQTALRQLPADLHEYIALLKERLAAMTPVEETARKALEVELSVAQLVHSFRPLQCADPTWLDISLLQMTTQQPTADNRESWLVPRFALVPVFGTSPTCGVTYPDDEYSGSWSTYDHLIDREAMENDITGLKKFFGVRRSISYRFDAPLPDTIRNKAHIAKEHGFDVYLICDAKGQWNTRYEPADPLLVAVRHSKWIMLDLFDPTGIEQWVAEEMTTPLSVK